MKKLFITLICLTIGTFAAGITASAAPVASMVQASPLESISDGATVDLADSPPFTEATGGFKLQQAIGGRGSTAVIAPLIRVAGASSAKRAAERAAGGRAVRVVKKGGRFIVTVVSGGSARRCVVDAKSGRVMGCR